MASALALSSPMPSFAAPPSSSSSSSSTTAFGLGAAVPLSFSQPWSVEPIQWQQPGYLSGSPPSPVGYHNNTLTLPSGLTSRLSVIGNNNADGGGSGLASGAAAPLSRASAGRATGTTTTATTMTSTSGYSPALSSLFTDLHLAPLEASAASVTAHLLLNATPAGGGNNSSSRRRRTSGWSFDSSWRGGGTGMGIGSAGAALDLHPHPSFLPPPLPSIPPPPSAGGGQPSKTTSSSAAAGTGTTTVTTRSPGLPPLLEPAANFLHRGGESGGGSSPTALVVTTRPSSAVSIQLPLATSEVHSFTLPPALPTPTRYRPHLQRRRSLSLQLPEWNDGGIGITAPLQWEQDYAVMPPQVNYLRCGADSLKAGRGLGFGPRRTFFLGLPPPAPQSSSSSLLFSSSPSSSLAGGGGRQRDISCPRYCLPQVCAIQSAVNPPLL